MFGLVSVDNATTLQGSVNMPMRLMAVLILRLSKTLLFLNKLAILEMAFHNRNCYVCLDKHSVYTSSKLVCCEVHEGSTHYQLRKENQGNEE